MKGSLKHRFWPRGQEDARFPKAAVCRGTKQIKDINKTSIVGVQIHDHGWFTLMHLKPSIILFCLSTEHIQTAVGSAHSM